MRSLVCQTFGLHYAAFSREIHAIAVDSRAVESGDLFFAIGGAITDGHYFLHEAVKRGAQAVVIASDYVGPIPEACLVIRVRNTREALQHLARQAIASSSATRIAVTGSVGKTTTKEWIRTCLERRGAVLHTRGNHNSQIGLALTLLNHLHGDESYIVAEMGMSRAGEIEQLTQIVMPQVAVITQIALVHAASFASLEEIARAKAEIFAQDETTCCLYNADAPGVSTIAAYAKGGRSFSLSGRPEAFWSLRIEGEQICCREGEDFVWLPVPTDGSSSLRLGKHLYENLLATIATVRSVGGSWEDIASSLPALRLPPHRLERKVVGTLCCIDDSYNASEVSMRAALTVLAEQAPARRIAVLGSMKELGAFSEDCHRRIGEEALAAAHMLFCLGDECAPMIEVWQKEQRPWHWAMSVPELMDQLNSVTLSGDVILVKGSHSHRLWEVVEHLQPK